MIDRKSLREEQKRKGGILPFLLLGTTLIIIAVMVSTLSTKPSTKPNLNTINQIDNETQSALPADDYKVLAVMKNIDLEKQVITFLDIKSGQDITLTYTGGTNIIDKYDQIIAASQLSVGEIYDVYYETESSKIAKLQISKEAFEYKGINNFIVDRDKEIIRVVDKNYKYLNDVVLFYNNEKYDISDLDETDQITIKGYDKAIYSIIVTKGHGTLIFNSYDDFVGGTAYIGRGEIIPIVPDMVVTVREGKYDVTFEKGSLKGTKTVNVSPSSQVEVDMGEFKKPPIQKGMVTFFITPEGADLYIDGSLTDYKGPIELEYGIHSLKVILGGYTTYIGDVDVQNTSKTISIDLVEEAQEDAYPDNTNNTNDNMDNNEDGRVDSNEGRTDSENETTDNDDRENNNEDIDEVNASEHIYVQTPEGASVYFNGEFKGTAPVSFPKVSGTNYITLIKTGYQTKTYTVEIEEDKEDVKFSFPEMSVMQ